MMFLRLILIVILISPTIGEVYADSYQQNIKILSAKTKNLENELSELNLKLDSILSRVYSYREQQEKEYSIFREFGLRSLLKKAQSLTNLISNLDRKKNLVQKKLQRERETLYVVYNKKIDRLLAQLKLNTQDKPVLLNELKRVMTARSLLSPYISATYRSEVDSIYIDASDSAQDIIEKARILDDYKQRLNRELTVVEEKLETLKKHSYALNEISHLIEEESFFTETGFLKAVKRKNETEELKTTVEETKTGKNTELKEDVKEKEENTENMTQQDPADPLPGTASQNSSQTGDTSAQNETQTSPAQPNDPSSSSSTDSETQTENSGDKSIFSLFSRQDTKSDTIQTETPDKSSLDSSPPTSTENSDDKNNRLYNENEISTREHIKISERPVSPESEVETLERERENLKKLILEVQKRRNSLALEADKIRLMKMK